MTFNLLDCYPSKIASLGEKTLRNWPCDTPFHVPYWSTLDEIRNYLIFLPDSSSIVPHSKMNVYVLQFLAMNFPVRLRLFLPPYFEIHIANLFLSYLPYGINILLDGFYTVDLLNLLPNGCHLILKKNVVDGFLNIPCFLPKHCTITISENISTFKLSSIQMFLKPQQAIITQNEPKLSAPDAHQNHSFPLLESSNTQEAAYSSEEKMVANILIEISKNQQNLSDIPGLFIQVHRIGLMNSLLLSVANALSLDENLVQDSLQRYIKEFNYLFTFKFGIENYKRIIQSLENHHVVDWRIFEVVGYLYQREILVLSQQSLYYYQLSSNIAPRGIPLYFMFDCFNRFHAYQRNSQASEGAILQNVFARYPNENIKRFQIR